VIFVLRPQARTDDHPAINNPTTTAAFFMTSSSEISCSKSPAPYLAVTRKSSKYVTESALVHRPTLPASWNVSSVASIFFAPSSEQMILFPTDRREEDRSDGRHVPRGRKVGLWTTADS